MSPSNITHRPLLACNPQRSQLSYSKIILRQNCNNILKFTIDRKLIVCIRCRYMLLLGSTVRPLSLILSCITTAVRHRVPTGERCEVYESRIHLLLSGGWAGYRRDKVPDLHFYCTVSISMKRI